jgi:hypothetical protein
MAEAAEAMRKDQWIFMDRLQARQTSDLMFVSGKTLEKPIDPGSCMAFDWESKNSAPPREMTEEDMEEFDRNMDSHRGQRNNG